MNEVLCEEWYPDFQLWRAPRLEPQRFEDYVVRLALMVMKTYPQAAKYASMFRYPRQVAQKFVQVNGQAIQYLPKNCRTCKTVVLAAKTFPDAVKHAPDDLRAKLEKLGDKIGQHVELLASLYDAK
jgi:hypothetical protein